ncbi:putative glycosyl hydrolase [Paraconexibacter sp. AEG42_29]|uniref:Glycosyl hydrolase n=1 Tax=Paraconexibacter sp. AEG42_29 TaxID=2997339 RepID=A0AAU7B3E5_9ACTN
MAAADDHRRVIDPWALTEEGIDLDNLGRAESLFALSNGHIGLRGNLDEGEPRELSGTYLNGFYESYPLEYGERGYGFAEDGQVVVNVTDGKLIRLQVEDEPLDVHRGALEEHTRRLDFRTGTLERTLIWRSSGGHRVRVTTRRLVSLSLRSIVAISYEVEALDGPVRVALQSNLQANERQVQGSGDPRKAKQLQDTLEPCLHVDHDLRVVLAHRTRESRLVCAAGMDHLIEHDGHPTQLTRSEPDFGRVTLSAELEPGSPLKLTKLLAYHWSGQQSVEWLRDQVDASLESARDEGFDGLLDAQREIMDEFWSRGDIVIDGDDELQQALRFAMFQLCQQSFHASGRALAAKGLTGTGYDGHAFWDTEGYVLPVLTYVMPKVVRAALEWRHSTLDLARERAAQLGLGGATLPWRTIHGEECSGYWPASTAAFHVNAAVAGAVVRYVTATGDTEFGAGAGLELLVESARLWVSLGFHDDAGAFHLPGVTGPDEYTALVDDNVYTNLTAQQNLWSAAAAADRYGDAAAVLGVDDDERAAWVRAADAMHVPYDEERGLHPQDSAFLEHETWDFEATPAEHYPLLLHYPYVRLYARQVIKQADLVLAMHVRGDAFTPEQKRANFDYYESITVRDSSLSACTQAVMAAEVGHLDLAMDHLREAAFMDVRDLARNTGDGVHLASLAGAVIAVVAGLGGFRDHAGTITFRPRLPAGIDRLCFPVTVGGTLLRVELADGRARYTVEGDGSFELTHEQERCVVTADEPAEHPLAPWPHDRVPPSQPAGREPGVVRPDGSDARHRATRSQPGS